jgi:hypothetical protein
LAEAVDHVPPALSHSAFVFALVTSVDVPLGLADGVVEELPDEPDEVPDDPELLPLPVVPDGLLLEPELEPPLPEVPPEAAATAGARAIAATRSIRMTFCI